MTYFNNINTLEELKKAYRKLAIKLHPDRGGDSNEFIRMKDEYDKLFSRLNTSKETNETYSNIIDALISYDLDIEIIGTWIWIQGDTKPIKEKLKELKFRWSGKKQAWYWHDGEYKKRNRKNYSLDEIRSMHDSKKVKTGAKKAALA